MKTGRRMNYLETKSPYDKQHGKSLVALNMLRTKYTPK